MENKADGRWEIAPRNTTWVTIIARRLTRWGITSSQVSIVNIFFAMVGCLLLIGAVIDPGFNKYVAYILLIACMQSWLLCNLFDGMVVIEGGKKSTNGGLYNNMLDRFIDVLFIVPVGYAAGGLDIGLGWLVAPFAVMTTYFRWIGACKAHQHFSNGPMARQHRMALLMFAFVIATCTVHVGHDRTACLIVLITTNVNLVATLVHRLYLTSHATNSEIK